MKSIFKYMSFPFVILLLLGALCSSIWHYEYKFEKKLIKVALHGNPYAIKILHTKIKINKENREVLEEALKGNKYALEILGIDPLPEFGTIIEEWKE